jgi:Zn-dependent peptidase ImmA (M78 family)
VAFELRPETVEFDLAWDEPHVRSGDNAAEATRGRLELHVDGRRTWPSPDGHVDWTWVELLEHLAIFWPHLNWEMGYPFGLNPTSPTHLWAEAERHWSEMTENKIAAQEKTLSSFEIRHDLSHGLQGIDVPSLWYVREGNEVWLATPRKTFVVAKDEASHALESVGTQIRNRLEEVSDCERARRAIQEWTERNETPSSKVAEIYTGFDYEQLMSWTNGEPAQEGEFEPNEVLAAARMFDGPMSEEDKGEILRAIKSESSIPTKNLDDISNDVLSNRDEWSSSAPYEEGYRLANMTRRILYEDGPPTKIPMRALFGAFEVPIRELELQDHRIDAFACWGPNHGPVVFLNTRGRHAQHKRGERATLAHELCHLLVDRHSALPLAEVQTGRAPLRPEQRARAFAAEFLLPREIAAKAAGHSTEPASLVKSLSQKYGVSHELVGWQILNSESQLPPELERYLRGAVR